MLYVDGGIETFRENDGNYTGDLTTPSFVGVSECKRDRPPGTLFLTFDRRMDSNNGDE